MDARLHDGKHIPTRINGLLVRLPLTITNSDRRYLQPEPAAGTTPVPSLEPRVRIPTGAQYAFTTIPKTRKGQHNSEPDDYDDLLTAVS